MATGLIGALRVTLGIDASEFVAGTKKAQAEVRSFQREFERTGKRFQSIGKDMTKWVTVPILGAGAAVIKLAGDFQSSMIQVGINANATGQQMQAMREQALNIGKDTAVSASEAANAMNMLAKTGVSAKDILDGAAMAAVNLAVATGSELDPATAAISDTMRNFHKSASDLPSVIDQITGAVNQSKFDFDDFQMAMGMGGAVAASSGVEFEDFTAALAGTAQAFSSGSDAGTSFKTFIQRLVPQSKGAAAMMKQLGLSFYDAQGNLKPMADIAENLKQKLSGLSEEARNNALKQIFGQDATRTAVALMNLGAEGINKFKAAIGDTSAVDQANARMQGFNGQLEQLKGALETLAIRIADSGLLEWATNLVIGLGNLVDKLGQTNPEFLKWGLIVAGVAASFGPFMLVFGTFIRAVGVGLPLLMKLGPLFSVLATGISYLIPVVAALARVLIAGLLANPILTAAAVLITGIYLAWKNWDKIAPIVQRLYAAVKTWIMDKLSAVWDWLHTKIDQVTGWFRNMYDAVVGHSYVPDMVNEIGQHMRRLDAEMARPVQAAVEKVKKGMSDAQKEAVRSANEMRQKTVQAFQQMQQEVSNILARIFPEQTRYNQYLDEVKTVQDGMKKLGFTADETTAAVQRLRDEYATETFGNGLPDWLNDNTPLPNKYGPDFDVIGESADKAIKDITGITQQETLKQAQAWAEMARDAVSSMKGMVQSFKSGDILGGIEKLLDVVSQVIGLIGGFGHAATPVYNRGPSAGAGPPGYATGGSFKIGGSGGVDSKLVQFRGTPGEHVTVRRGDQMDRPGPSFHFDLRNAVVTQDLLEQMNAIGDQSAQRGAVGGAALAARHSARARRTMLR